MNFSEYVGHVTIFSGMLTTACCLVVGLRLRLGLDLVSGWLVVSTCIYTTFRCKCHSPNELGLLAHGIRQAKMV